MYHHAQIMEAEDGTQGFVNVRQALSPLRRILICKIQCFTQGPPILGAGNDQYDL